MWKEEGYRVEGGRTRKEGVEGGGLEVGGREGARCKEGGRMGCRVEGGRKEGVEGWRELVSSCDHDLPKLHAVRPLRPKIPVPRPDRGPTCRAHV